MIRRWVLSLALALLPGLIYAADGIPAGVNFKVPFTVDGKAVVNRASVSVDSKGQATLHVLFVAGEDISEAVYLLTRQDSPGPDPKPNPNPNPNPQPDPKPDPIPVPPAELWGIVVEESSQRTPEQAVVLASPKVRTLFDKDRLRVIDKDTEVPADLKPYLDRAAAMAADKQNPVPLPILFIPDPAGKIWYEGALPKTIALTEELIAKIRKGGKP